MKASRWVSVQALVLAAALPVVPALPARAEDDSGVLVLTSLPATYSIASALAQGTRIQVANVPEAGRPMNALDRYLEKPGEDDTALLRRADAVVTIGKLWREDPLYTAARAYNIRVVNIDATEPYSRTMPGIALTREPGGQAPWQKAGTGGAAGAVAQADGASLHFWLGPSNGARSAEIVAHDLARLSPADAERIGRNLADYRGRLLQLKQSYEAKLAELENVTVFALSGDFAYLTTDLGLFVEGYFIRQDIEWTPADLEAFRKHLMARDIRVVIHEWEPSEAIRQAITAAGAKLVVLRSGETFKPGYLADMEANLEALYSTLKP